MLLLVRAVVSLLSAAAFFSDIVAPVVVWLALTRSCLIVLKSPPQANIRVKLLSCADASTSIVARPTTVMKMNDTDALCL